MLKVLVKAIGTDLFLKVIRVDVEVSDESAVESFSKFVPLDESKKPTAQELENLVESCKGAAVRDFRMTRMAELAQLTFGKVNKISVAQAPEAPAAPAPVVEAPAAPAPAPVVEAPAPAPVAKRTPKFKPAPAPVVEAPAPVAAPAPVVEAPAPVAAPAPVVEAPAPVAATPAMAAAVLKATEIPAETTPIGPSYDEEGMDENPPVVILDLRNQQHMLTIRSALASVYGAGWNTDKTSQGYIKATAHLKSMQGKPFFLADGTTPAESSLKALTDVLDAHFTRAEEGLV